jgi:RNA polymerase subunit RPABC4/transcription elongation factor Spt4
MTIPSLETLTSLLTIFAAVLGALLAALWLSLIIWAFRDMRARSRDPFAQILAALVVAALPFVGIIIYFILRPPETLAEAYERALEEEALLQEIEERPACPGCSRTIEANWILCPYCHTRLRKVCPDCQSLMELTWNLCPFCGNHHIDPYHVAPPESPVTAVSIDNGAARAEEQLPRPEPIAAQSETAVDATSVPPPLLPTTPGRESDD